MWTKKIKSLSIFVISAYLCLSVPFVGICYSSQMYQITETELMTLENHLTALEQNNETLKMLLSESDESLTIALEKLMESQSELATLKAQLQKAKSDAESANQSLKIANDELAKASQSFKAYEIARDKTENRLRNQRNIWEILCAIAVGFAVVK